MSVFQRLQPLLDTSLSFIYPNCCQICQESRATAAEGYVCTRCWQKVRFIVPPFCDRCGLPFAGDITVKFECRNCRDLELSFRSARSAVLAKGVVRDVIVRYKYENALWFETFLADLLIRAAAPFLMKEPCDMLIPVPLFSSRERDRQFNQAERLAAHLGRATNSPVRRDVLKRTRPTNTQTRLKRAERSANVRNAFALADDRISLKGQRVVLLDDVFTTGATTNSCAKVLKKAGAADVFVWTVARGL